MAILTSVTTSGFLPSPPRVRQPKHVLRGPIAIPAPQRGTHTLHQDLAWGGDWPTPFHAEVFSKPKPSHATSRNSALQWFPVDLRDSVPMGHRPFLPPPWVCWALRSGRSAPCPQRGPSDLPLSCSFFLGHSLPTRTPAVWQTSHSSGFGLESTSLGPQRLGSPWPSSLPPSRAF